MSAAATASPGSSRSPTSRSATTRRADTERSIGDYYSFSPEYASAVVAATAKGEDGVRERIEAFRDAGVDEVVMFPASPDPQQVDLLAAIAL